MFDTKPPTHWACSNCLIDNFPFNRIENQYEYLSELAKISLNVDLEILNNKAFIPFQVNDDDNHNIPLFDCDPDLNYFSSLTNTNINKNGEKKIKGSPSNSRFF